MSVGYVQGCCCCCCVYCDDGYKSLPARYVSKGHEEEASPLEDEWCALRWVRELFNGAYSITWEGTARSRGYIDVYVTVSVRLVYGELITIVGWARIISSKHMRPCMRRPGRNRKLPLILHNSHEKAQSGTFKIKNIHSKFCNS